MAEDAGPHALAGGGKELGRILGRVNAGLALDLQLAKAGELRSPASNFYILSMNLVTSGLPRQGNCAAQHHICLVSIDEVSSCIIGVLAVSSDCPAQH